MLNLTFWLCWLRELVKLKELHIVKNNSYEIPIFKVEFVCHFIIHFCHLSLMWFKHNITDYRTIMKLTERFLVILGFLFEQLADAGISESNRFICSSNVNSWFFRSNCSLSNFFWLSINSKRSPCCSWTIETSSVTWREVAKVVCEVLRCRWPSPEWELTDIN